MRQRDGGDHCTGSPVQPFRVAGLPNYPNKKKQQRGRTVVPTRLVLVSTVTYTAEKLLAHFSACPSATETAQQLNSNLEQSRPAYCRSKAMVILAAEPGSDRSAALMAAVRYAAWGNIPPEQLEAIARKYPCGCVSKYLESGDRLRQEILRCYSKIK